MLTTCINYLQRANWRRRGQPPSEAHAPDEHACAWRLARCRRRNAGSLHGPLHAVRDRRLDSEQYDAGHQ